jgi:hypothetical protein
VGADQAGAAGGAARGLLADELSSYLTAAELQDGIGRLAAFIAAQAAHQTLLTVTARDWRRS